MHKLKVETKIMYCNFSRIINGVGVSVYVSCLVCDVYVRIRVYSHIIGKKRVILFNSKNRKETKRFEK